MYDMNFFSNQKRSKSKNKSFKIFLIFLVIVAVILNAVLIIGGQMIFSRLEDTITQKEAFINDAATKDKIKEAEIISEEAILVSEYYTLLQSAGASIEAMKHLDSHLLDEIRKLTPLEVTFQNMSILDRKIRIDCTAENELAALDMYHAFLTSDLFINIQITSINVNIETQQSTYTIDFAVKGE